MITEGTVSIKDNKGIITINETVYKLGDYYEVIDNKIKVFRPEIKFYENGELVMCQYLSTNKIFAWITNKSEKQND